jgi:hypothetical protein
MVVPSTPVGSAAPVAPITPDTQDASNTIGLQDTVVMGNVSINDAHQSPAAQHTAGMQPVFTTITQPNYGEMIQNVVAIGITIIIIIGGIWFAFPEWLTSDDDNDGIHNDDDWYDEGNGGLAIEFTIFDIWDEGYYDDGGGNPDVYAYVGLGDGNCNNMVYYEYLDSIHEDVASMRNWDEWAMDIPDDQQSACVSVMIYDEDSWAPDEVLDYVPGSANHYTHTFNLAAGEGDASVSKDNRGENELSIRLAYKISRVTIAS